MPNTSPNMNLIVPIPNTGVTGTGDSGPGYAVNISNDLYTTIDQHDHSSGKGVNITPAGININADLNINDNNLTQVRSSTYFNQPSNLSGVGDINNVYVYNGNLWYNNGSGQQIQLTSGSSLVAINLSGDVTGLPASNIVQSIQGGVSGVTVNTGNIVFSSTQKPVITLSPVTATGLGNGISIIGQTVSGTSSIGGQVAIYGGQGGYLNGIVCLGGPSVTNTTIFAGGGGVGYGIGGGLSVTNGNYTLTYQQSQYPYIFMIGSLSGNVNVAFPANYLGGATKWYIDPTHITYNGHSITFTMGTTTWGQTITTPSAMYEVLYNGVQIFGKSFTP